MKHASGRNDGELKRLKCLAFIIQLIGMVINARRRLLFQEQKCMTGPTKTPGHPQAIRPLCPR